MMSFLKSLPISLTVLVIGAIVWYIVDRLTPDKMETHSRIYHEWWKEG